MKPSCLLVALLTVVVCGNAAAQTSTGVLTGRVTEKSTGQSIAGARISVGRESGTTATTDAAGEFRVPVQAGVYEIEAAASGFQSTVRAEIAITGGRTTVVNFELQLTVTENVEVRNDIFGENSEQPVSNITLNREDVRATPGTAGDLLRVINSQPAVAAASGEFADLIVRGGNSDENLTFIDNIPVRDFTYFTDSYDGGRGGRAGILPPDVFERAEFSAGGFGVRYGDRMSSALDVDIREAGRERVQGVLFADSGTAGGSLDVPLGERGGWLVSARRSYIDVALDVAGIADRGVIGYPRTWDLTNKLDYDLTSRHSLALTAVNMFESFDQTDEQAINIDRRTDRFRTNRTSQRHVFGATLSSTLSSGMLARTTVYGAIADNDGTFFRPFTGVLQRSRDLHDSEFGIKVDLLTSLSRSIDLAAGGGVYVDHADYHSFENTGQFISPLEEEFRAAPRANSLRLGATPSAYAYVQSALRPIRSLSVTPGVRVDRYGITDETLVSPRLGARYSVSRAFTLTFATGVYRQPPSLFVLSLTPSNRDLQAQRSTHVIGGVEWQPRADLRVRLEGYRKTYDRSIVQPIFPTATFAVTGDHFNTGSGESRGLEVSVQKALTGFFSGQASYSFLRSNRRFFDGGPEFASDFGRPHQLTMIGITRFRGFSIAAKYRLVSGLPYTRRTPVEAIPMSGLFLQRIVSLSDINELRLPDFASLDLRGEKRFGFRRWSFAPYIDIFNITNHDSIVQPNYEFHSPAPQFLRENRRLPIFGFRLEF